MIQNAKQFAFPNKKDSDARTKIKGLNANWFQKSQLHFFEEELFTENINAQFLKFILLLKVVLRELGVCQLNG